MMGKIKSSIHFLKTNVIKNKAIVLSFILIFIMGIVAVPRIFAQLQPVRSVEIFSEELDYEKKEPGAWKIDKSAQWISKGTAEITFDVDTVMKSNVKYTDVLFVLDISGSMNGEKLDRVKADSTQLIERLLSNDKNRVGLITFDSVSEVLSDFTNDKDALFTGINNLSTKGATNYYKALTNVDTVLKDYVKENDRECIVLFLTDGFPCEETPNEVGQYSYLKSQYPFITINGVQYEMGSTILDSIKNISDNQYIANMENLNNILFEASISPVVYENFEITDYIDTNYFYVENESDIKVSQGNIIFDKENQKFTWKMDNLKSGLKAKMTIKAKLKDELIGEGGLYPTNEKEEIKSKIDEDEEDVESTKTPILSDKYKVIYDGNEPDDCRVEGVPGEKQYSVFDTVAISDTVPKCEGYQFKGWNTTSDNVKTVNGNYFSMPEEDVEIVAIWSKLTVSKSIEGKLYVVPTLYNYMANSSKGLDSDVDFGVSPTEETSGVYMFESTKNDKYPIYYYRGILENNNVLFAGFCWKAVRTTETGGVKLLYNGTPSSVGNCNNTGEFSQIGSSPFNNDYTDSKYVGYTYDDNVDSTIKNYVDEWYRDNMVNYTEMLEDTIWCSDSSFSLRGSDMFYGVRDRLFKAPYKPDLRCLNENDKYTVSSNNGNGLLKYPISLLSADEVALAGNGNIGYTSSGYLYTGQWWWVLSPSSFVKNIAYVFRVYNNGQLYSNEYVNTSGGVRPAISLRGDIKCVGGNGAVDSPYIIDMDS